MIKLPDPSTRGTVSVEETIVSRRSVRAFNNKPLNLEQISQLLWAAQGITSKRGSFRAAPSAGATYPLETYVVTKDGIYRYISDTHSISTIKEGDFRRELAEAALGQGFVAQAGANIVFTAIAERTTGRYGRRGYRYIHMEAGHAAQNMHLQAVALGLGSVPVGAFSDGEVEEILGCRGRETALYIITVGHPR